MTEGAQSHGLNKLNGHFIYECTYCMHIYKYTYISVSEWEEVLGSR